MFGIADNVRSKVMECTPERFHAVLDSPKVDEVCAELVDVLEAHLGGALQKEGFEMEKARLKKKLPVFTPHAHFPGGRRVNADAVPSGLAMYDKDHINDPRGWWKVIEERAKALGIVFAHITPSTQGCRLFFIIPQGMDIPDAQAWMAQQLGDADYDACVKDYARCSFAVPRSYVLYLDEEGLFAPVSPQITPISTDKNLPADGVSNENKENNLCQSVESVVNQNYPSTFEEIPYEEIVRTLEEQLGGTPEVGIRNNFIFTMARHLRSICNNDPDWIASILPLYGETHSQWVATIRSACGRRAIAMPPVLARTLKLCKRRRAMLNETVSQADQPPRLPAKLPPLIKLLLSKVPEIYWGAVASAVFPSLAAHLWQVTFRYIDQVEHEATLMNVLMAPTGAGKNCISEPINRIMADIRARDAESLRREKEWKDETQAKGANKDKRKRPAGLVVQEVDADCTNAAFVLRLSEADGRFLYAKMNELDQLDALKNSARSKSHFQIICLAFDPGNTYGQTRVGTGSVSARVCVRFNWKASATIGKGQAYFRSVLVDGPVSRINFCTIPERPIGSEIPVFGTYDAAFDEALRPYIDRLNEARGLIECPKAFKLAKKMMEEKAEEARLSQNRVYENLSFRANVIAYLKGMVLYVAHGGKWDKTMEDFVRWSLDYDLWCKMRFFGKAIEDAENGIEAAPARGPKNLLDLLPTVFTLEDAVQVRSSQGIQSGSAKQMLANWKFRRYIDLYGEPCEDANRQQYTKTEEYLKKYSKDHVGVIKSGT